MTYIKSMSELEQRIGMLRRAAGSEGGQFRLHFGDAEDGTALLRRAFDRTRMAMCVTDPHLPDNPIVYANAAFERLTGYGTREIVGSNCRFLQGEDTDPAAIEELRAAIRHEGVCIVEVRNYRKDGRAFWNALHIGPIYDEHGRLRFYFGSQWDATETRRAREAQGADQATDEVNQRIRDLFAILGSIVHVSARDAGADRGRRRIAALGRAHEGASDPLPGRSAAHLDRLAETILAPFRTGVAAPIRTAGSSVVLQISAITPLGLILHELATNSARYGTLGGHGEGLEFTWTSSAAGLQLIWRDASKPTRAQVERAGSGSRIIEGMVRSFGGTWTVGDESGAYAVRIELPAQKVLLQSEPVDRRAEMGLTVS